MIPHSPLPGAPLAKKEDRHTRQSSPIHTN